MTKKAVFLDRDGTLIIDYGYVHQISQVELLPGVPESLIRLQGLGFELIVVSNQSGIGRGFFTSREVDEVNRYLQYLLSEYGVTITDFYYCPHSPAEKCICRKPKPGLLLKALKEHQIDPTHSYFVGDKLTDAEAALAAGIRPVFLTSNQTHAIGPVPIEIVDNLLTWSKLINPEVDYDNNP